MKFIQVILALFLFVGITQAEKLSTEMHISLNGTWNFKADYNNQGEAQNWMEIDFNDTGWDKMTVPGNWDLRNEYASFSGKGWYRTTFETPTESKGKVIRLNFEAVGIDYKVWLNGELIANVTGGYFSNFINISDRLKSGVKNTLVVSADNTFHSGAYWSWGGIRRPVTLVINNSLFFELIHITAIPDLKKGTATVSVNTSVFNSDQLKAPVLVDYELSFAGKTIKKGSTSIQLIGVGSQQSKLEFNLAKKDVKLWHFDFPHLYTLKIQLKNGNVVTHEVFERFGIRKAEIVAGKFMLNGESVRAMGLNWVADDRLTGNTLPAEVYKRDIDNMKSIGVNLTRLSHVPLPKEVYDYLDEKGMMIIAEIPVWGMTKLADYNNPVPFSWLKQLVNSNFNHPSIIGWCVGNEIGYVEQNQHVMGYVEKAINYVKDSLDKSRIVVMVSLSASKQSDDPSKFGDFVPQNSYGGWGTDLDKIHKNQPNKAIFMTEFGENLIGEDLNTSTGDFAKMLYQIRGREYVFGASLWTYNDYRSFHRSSKLSWETKPSENRDWGVVDGYGNKKRAFEILRKEQAPFKSLVVKQIPNALQISLKPRIKLDLPAYTLRGFRVVCEEFGTDSKLINKTEVVLPTVNPGDSTLTKSIPVKGLVATRKISVVTPTGYPQMDTTIYYQIPDKPIIKAVFNNGERIRVVFDKTNFTTEYKLIYGENELNSISKSTIDNYIEVGDLGRNPLGKTYQLQLIAVNAFGENRSEIYKEKILEHGAMPPVIKAVKAFQGGISIGYSSQKMEYLYKVQYSIMPDFSSDSPIIQTTSKGACYIPDLNLGVRYYVRMSAVEQYEIVSPWGESYSVVIN